MYAILFTFSLSLFKQEKRLLTKHKTANSKRTEKAKNTKTLRRGQLQAAVANLTWEQKKRIEHLKLMSGGTIMQN